MSSPTLVAEVDGSAPSSLDVFVRPEKPAKRRTGVNAVATIDTETKPAVSDKDEHQWDLELGQMLSVSGRVPITSSSSSVGKHVATQAADTSDFTKIGAGACGAVFHQDGKSWVVKLAKSSDGDLWNDYIMHARIYDAIQKHGPASIRIPRHYFFVPRDRSEFFDRSPGLAATAENVCNLPTAALVTERILPLSARTRQLLISKYCPQEHRVAAMSDPANQDCLVRLYLGSIHSRHITRFFSLRNLKLHLNQVLDLGLDLGTVAKKMGEAMACIHWAAKTDGRDVEFVLGRPSCVHPRAASYSEIRTLQPMTYTGPETCPEEDLVFRPVELFVLDFNQVRAIALDERGVAQAVEAARMNDPYIPRPSLDTPIGKGLWRSFGESYIALSGSILAEEPDSVRVLPQTFLEGFAAACKVRRKDL